MSRKRSATEMDNFQNQPAKNAKFNLDFEWKIPQFASHMDAQLISDVFRKSPEDAMSWKICLLPNEKDEEDEEHEGWMSIFLDLADSPEVDLKTHVIFNLNIVNHHNPEKSVIIQGDHVFSHLRSRGNHPQNSYGDCNIIERAEILRKSSGFLADGELTITCQMDILNDRYRKEELLTNQARLFDLHQFTDCVLVCDDGEVPACKFLLASQSAVFHAMFSSDSVEAKTGQVVIKDCSSLTMTELCRFTSCGKVENLGDIADDLVLAADKYHMESLKVMCAVKMCETLRKENVCRRLILADRHNVSKLKESATQFIAHHCTEMKTLDEYEEFLNHKELVLSVFDRLQPY